MTQQSTHPQQQIFQYHHQQSLSYPHMSTRQNTELLNHKLQQKLSQMHEEPGLENVLLLEYMPLQKIQPSTRTILEHNFCNVSKLSLNNCDLRTFENFPKLPKLLELDVAKNSLQGSFEFLVNNRNLEYLDISDNIIKDVMRLEPLRLMKSLCIYAKNNPFYPNGVNREILVNKIKAKGLTFLKQPKRCRREAVAKKESEPPQKETEKQEKNNPPLFGILKCMQNQAKDPLHKNTSESSNPREDAQNPRTLRYFQDLPRNRENPIRNIFRIKDCLSLQNLEEDMPFNRTLVHSREDLRNRLSVENPSSFVDSEQEIIAVFGNSSENLQDHYDEQEEEEESESPLSPQDF